jgi:hypothetical protein
LLTTYVVYNLTSKTFKFKPYIFCVTTCLTLEETGTMSDSIQTFLKDGKLKTSLLTVKLIKNISLGSYIIADKSMVAILDIHETPDNAKNMQTGSWYKLIKCQKGEGSTIKLNKLFKPVKTIMKEDIEDFSEEAERLEKSLEAKASTKKYEDFQSIENKPNHSKIDRITVKVITKSRIISTNKGNYQICNIKDANGDTASINLYSKHLNKLEQFQIFTITNLRKGEINKNDQTKMRLHSTGFTKIEVGTMEDSVNFQNIGNGDESITGVVIGFGDIAIYQSCKVHYNKLDDDLKCPKCNVEIAPDDILEDFRSEVYIEASKDDNNENETDVKEIIFFKKALTRPQDFPQNNIEEKLNAFTGKTAKIDYNIDDANRFVAVSIQLI